LRGRRPLGQVVRIGLEVPGVGNEEFELFAEQALAQALPVIHLELHPGLGITPDEAADGPGDQPCGWRRATAEAQLSRFQAIELADLVGHLLGAADQPARVLQQQLALLGRRQVLAPAIHQLAADAVFQGLDAAAEGRLREVHRRCGRDKAALFGEGDEVAELAQVDMHFSHKKYRGNALAMH